MKVPSRKIVRYALCGAALAAAIQAQAATVLFDFNTDPTASGLLTLSGNAAWRSTDGSGASTNANDGYLSITDAQNGQGGTIIFADFDGGAVVQAFTFQAEVRIGNGTADPADGFSINYARSDDPVLTGGAWATGPNCELSLPEEGTQTGISIGFDAWNSGGSPPFCNEADQSIGPDIIGVSVRVDGTLVKQFATPTENGNCTDPTSLQTGPRDGTGNPDILCWAPVRVTLDTNGVLNVYWKNTLILSNYQTAYFPSAGRLVFGGRTGNANENHHVDNILITTIPASIAQIGGASGFPDGFRFTISDSGNSVVNTNTLSVQMNSSPITPTSVAKSGGVTTVDYRIFPALLPPGSTNQLHISVNDTNGNNISGNRSFVVPTYGTVPSALAVTGVDTTKPGFRYFPYQSPGEPNRVYWANEQIAGLHGANLADLSSATNGGYVNWIDVINFNIQGGADQGNFTTANGHPDSPGVGFTIGNTDNTAFELLTFLRFNSGGIYTMGVNSDDGFAVTVGRNPKDRFAQLLGQFDGGRGASDTTFTFAVTNAGIYPFRLLWENGGGGANCEWFLIKNGAKILINDPDPTNTTGVAAFYAGPALPAYASQINPYDGATGTRPDTLLVQLTDLGTTVNGGSISMTVNGSPVTTTVTKVGSVTTVRGADGTHLLSAGPKTARLIWSDSGGTTVTNTWAFTVAPYATLDPSLASAISLVDSNKPGFTLHVAQVDPCLPHVINPATPDDCGDGTENQIDSANAMVAGLYFPWYGTNAADISTSVSGNTWYWNDVMDFNITGSPGDFGTDRALPGIPSADGVANRPYDSFSASFDSYIVIPAPGFYVMGVNSDDGFRLSEGIGVSRQVLHVSSGTVDRDVAAVVTSTNNTGNPWNNGLPATPITAPVVYVGSAGCPNPTTVNLAGKIALIDQDRCTPGSTAAGGYNTLVYMCQTNGAVACIVVAYPGWGTPERMAGGAFPITIPALHVNGYNGERDWWLTNGPLTATIGADTHLKLGEADAGKGMSHVDFGVAVPQAGAYPMHLIYEQGGGGAGMEWTLVQPDIAYDSANRSLINELGNPNSLMAFRDVHRLQFLTETVSGGNLTITWDLSGILQSAPGVNGPWTDVSPQPTGNSYTTPATGPAKFFRLRQ